MGMSNQMHPITKGIGKSRQWLAITPGKSGANGWLLSQKAA
jgi:hypothetical protein